MIEELWSELLHFVETLVSPDWGALIAMIPLILAGLTGLFFVWILVRFMRASSGGQRSRRHAAQWPEESGSRGSST